MKQLKQMVFVLWLAVVCVISTGDNHIFASDESTGQINLWFGGDVHLGDMGSNPFLALREITADHIGIVNLEGPIHEPATTLYDGSTIKLFNSSDSIRFLKTLNVQIANVANNHQDDAGEKGKQYTEQVLLENEITPLGGSHRQAILLIHDYRLVFLAFDLSDTIPVNLGSTVENHSKRGELLFIIFHVSGPPSYLPDKRLTAATDRALEAGATAVVSHGTHAIGPVERRGNKIIAWGLGNVVFNCECTNDDEGIILTIAINPKDKENPILSACVVPIDAGLNGLSSTPSKTSDSIFDLLAAIGSKKLIRQDYKACF